MTCGECAKGKKTIIVGNGITEPPYISVIKCPYDTEFFKYPEDECKYEAESEA